MGCGVWGVGCRVEGVGCRVEVSRFRVSGFGCREHGAGFLVQIADHGVSFSVDLVENSRAVPMRLKQRDELRVGYVGRVAQPPHVERHMPVRPPHHLPCRFGGSKSHVKCVSI